MLAELTGEGMSGCCQATDELELCAPKRKGHKKEMGLGFLSLEMLRGGIECHRVSQV